MFRNVEKHRLVFTTALAGLLIPGLAFSATKAEPWTTRFLSADGEVLADDRAIDPQAPTYLVVHGFQGSGTDAEYLEQAAAIGKRFPKANVVIVHWRPPPRPKPAKGRWPALVPIPPIFRIWEYSPWAKQAEHAGQDIAKWLKDRKIAPSRTVIVGHSLGGQVAAFASNECAKKKLCGQPVRGILASDPAGPLFQGLPPEKRLDGTDARKVIVVHTTALLGDENAIGTVDIYVPWPESKQEELDEITTAIKLHNWAKKLVTESFLRPEMSNDDGTPFGANALGSHFGDGKPRTFRPGKEPRDGSRDGENQKTDLASIEPPRSRMPGTQGCGRHPASATSRTRFLAWWRENRRIPRVALRPGVNRRPPGHFRRPPGHFRRPHCRRR